MSESPYKFLASYSLEDSERFFGRDLEIDLLLADVVISRLVVLFAKTGTGKTSLINAGVRPRLHERGYATFVVRTREDPIDSARTTLAQEAPRRFPPTGDLAYQLRVLAQRLRRPIVVFFDQFEEFFLYLVNRDVARAESFVSAVADLHDDARSDVHIVFSMREEWFVDMGFFRDQIPAVFHNDSNLRLRWFDSDQARAAIVGPVGEKAYDPDLVDRLIVDLIDAGRAVAGTPSPGDIEPAQLQIVCDTLWRRHNDRALTVHDYEALASPMRSESVAGQILDRRLVEVFEQVGEREELEVVTRILPELATTEHTKRVREYNDLVASLLSSKEASSELTVIRRVLERLRDERLLDIVPRESGELVELTHDYLVLRLDHLVVAIGLIWPRRQLSDALKLWTEGKTLIAAAALPDVLERAADLDLDAHSGELLLRSALAHLAEVAPAAPALERSGADIYAILDERAREGSSVERVRALETLVELASPAAITVLLGLLDDAEAATLVLSALTRSRDPALLRVLEEAVGRRQLAAPARAALAELAESPPRDELTRRAAAALRRSLRGLPPRTAARVIVELDSPLSPTLLAETAGPDASAALVGLAARASRLSVRAAARRVVFERVAQMVESPPLEPWAIDGLGSIEAVASVSLLARIAVDAPEHLKGVEQALQQLKQSEQRDVAANAAKELDRLAGEPVKPPPARPFETRGRREGFGDNDRHYREVLQLLANGRVIPFLGAGVALLDRTDYEGWQRGVHSPSGAELARYLASEFSFPPELQSDLIRAATWVAITLGTDALYYELREVFEPVTRPNRLHRFLAELPARFRAEGRPTLPTIATVSFDRSLEHAFMEAAEPFDVLTYIAHGSHAGRFLHTAHGGEQTLIDKPWAFDQLAPYERTIILRLNGGISGNDPAHDSFVITEDDFLDYPWYAADRNFFPPALSRLLTESAFLFLGYPLWDWNIRFVLRSLWRDRSRTGYRSWAVMENPGELVEKTWKQGPLEIIDRPLELYVAELAAYFDDFDLGSIPA
jgi:hypothetical protein